MQIIIIYFAGAKGVRVEPAEGAGGGRVALHRREQRSLLRLRRRRQDGQGRTRINSAVVVSHAIQALSVTMTLIAVTDFWSQNGDFYSKNRQKE